MRILILLGAVVCFIAAWLIDGPVKATVSTMAYLFIYALFFERAHKWLAKTVFVLLVSSIVWASFPLITEGVDKFTAFIKKQKPAEIKIQVSNGDSTFSNVNLAEMPGMFMAKPVITRSETKDAVTPASTEKSQLKQVTPVVNTKKIKAIKPNLQPLATKEWSLALSHSIRLQGIKFSHEMAKPLNVIK